MARTKSKAGKSEAVGAILSKYENLRAKLGHVEGTEILAGIAADSFAYLETKASRENLKSVVAGKTYFAFKQDAQMSRAVNAGLFIDDETEMGRPAGETPSESWPRLALS